MSGVRLLVVNRANVILKELEGQRAQTEEKFGTPKVNPIQLSMFQLNDPVLEQIKEDLLLLDINTISPVEALMKLNEIKKLLK
jgi:DNA mismatch repair protein MutS